MPVVSTSPAYQPRLYWFAVITVLVMLTTLSAGALVTSKNAGMAFRDWPTSDGQGMFSYPWLQDFARDGKKFLEHGHRLAGALIGCWVIALVAVVARWETRGWVVGLAVALLAGVIIQGVLGGMRVWLDERGLALIHGFFAACVTALLATLVTVLSRGWFLAEERYRQAHVGIAKPLAVAMVALIAVQYLLGGAIRHQGTALHEHLGLGFLVGVAAMVNAWAAHRTGAGWVQGTGWLLLVMVWVQIVLGVLTWIAKWGWAPTGVVATADAIHQVAVRTIHMVVGIFVFASSVVHAVRSFRVAHVSWREEHRDAALPLPAVGGGLR